jgi:N-acyl-L-homoserine lactone synthetase
VPLTLASRPAGTESLQAPVVRVAHTRGDLLAAARLRALAKRGGHPAGSNRVVDIALDAYDTDPRARALHLLAVDEEEPVGTMRLLRAEAGRPLPVHRVFGLPEPEGVRVAELSRPALRRPNDHALLVSLLRAAYDEALAAGIDQLYLVADQPLLSLLRALGFRFRAVAGPVWAYGAWNIAAMLVVEDVLPGLRMHQAVHGCRIADFFTGPFDGTTALDTVCLRSAV